MKTTLQNAADASVASEVSIYTIANDICHLSHNLTCMLEILHEKADLVLFPGTTAEGIIDGPVAQNFNLIRPEEKRSIAFVLGDCLKRAEALDMAADKMSTLTVQLEHPPTSKTVGVASEELESVISTWRAAHEKWRERLSLGDEGDGPESKSEDVAAEALLSFQCRTDADVQRKVSLFAGNDHLASLAFSYSDLFLPSLIVSESQSN
ncbi:hypothetical protein QD336_17400 [Rhizobium sp. BR 250]